MFEFFSNLEDKRRSNNHRSEPVHTASYQGHLLPQARKPEFAVTIGNPMQ
jgi:hypothetical protein